MTETPTPQAAPDSSSETKPEQVDPQTQQGQTASTGQPDPKPAQGRKPLFRN